IDADRSISIGDHARFAERSRDREEGRIKSTAAFVKSGNFFGVCRAFCFLTRRRREGKISVEKCFEQNGARARFSLSSAVVRDEKSYIFIEDEMQIAVEKDRVTAVPDDPLAVSRLFVKAIGHGVQPIIRPVQPRM